MKGLAVLVGGLYSMKTGYENYINFRSQGHTVSNSTTLALTGYNPVDGSFDVKRTFPTYTPFAVGIGVHELGKRYLNRALPKGINL